MKKAMRQKRQKIEDETVNSASAMWTKSKEDLDDEAYNEFYKHVGHDFQVSSSTCTQ